MISNRKLFKTIFILSIFLSLNFQTTAQVELKLNPPGALYGIYQAGIEFPINANAGIEMEIIHFVPTEDEIIIGVIYHRRYYFKPDYGRDRIYIGIFAGAIGSGLLGRRGVYFLGGGGFEAGYKWLGKRNILFELGLGIGAGGSLEVFGPFPYARIMVGYRFPSKEKKK